VRAHVPVKIKFCTAVSIRGEVRCAVATITSHTHESHAGNRPAMEASSTIQTPSDAVKAYLASIPGISFRSPGDLVQFDANMSVDKALKTMNDNKITGAPVYVGSPLYDELTDVVRDVAPLQSCDGVVVCDQPCLELCRVQDAGGFSAAVAVSSKDYVGIVDVCDLATLILTKGLKRKTPEGVFAKLGDLFVSDSEHNVQSAVNLSTTHRFYALPTTGNLAQV
jgi:CBS domain-containing protein